MRLTQLHIHHVRNLTPLRLPCHPDWNVLLGPNGAGKTSILEAIHLLAVGRSFRSRQIKSVIAYAESTLSCYGEVLTTGGDKIPLGIERHRNGDRICKVHAEVCEKLSDFAAILPVQLITPESLKLLTAGPAERRRFIDWGVFHVEPQSGALYQRYQQLLKQRNATLKLSRRLTAFDEPLAALGEAIHHKRQAVITRLNPYLTAQLAALAPALGCDITYEPGWPIQTPLLAVLEASFGQDQRMGFTRLGPHTADMGVRVAGHPGHQVLSRGQLKLVLFALYLAQAQMVAAEAGKKCLYLLDDLASELDGENRQRLLGAVALQGHQVFLTGVDRPGWEEAFAGLPHAVFHVEHGGIMATPEIKSPVKSSV